LGHNGVSPGVSFGSKIASAKKRLPAMNVNHSLREIGSKFTAAGKEEYTASFHRGDSQLQRENVLLCL
jgi:hypothetical protein